MTAAPARRAMVVKNCMLIEFGETRSVYSVWMLIRSIVGEKRCLILMMRKRELRVDDEVVLIDFGLHQDRS